MDINLSPMQFINYKANKIYFEINDEFMNDGKIVELNPDITTEISELDGDKFTATIKFIVGKNDEENRKLPFKMEILLTGQFKFETEDVSYKESLMKNNAIIILLPYLRSLVTSITVGANIPPLVLPLLNLNSLVSE